MSVYEDIYNSIRYGKIRQTADLVRLALDEGCEPDQIVHEAMIPAMKAVGDDNRGDSEDITRILCAARSMRYGMDVLAPLMQTHQAGGSGSVIIGTVQGDLHEVGKDLVAIMMQSQGIEVIDLGVDVSARRFIQALREHPQTSIVCLSSLLSTSRAQVAETIRAIRRADIGRGILIMAGGGSMTREIALALGADLYTETAVDAADAAARYLRSTL